MFDDDGRDDVEICDSNRDDLKSGRDPANSIRVNGRLVHRNDLDLPRRQKQCLRYRVIGKTAVETGMILDLSNRTVERHLDMLRRSFDVGTCWDVVAKLREIGRQDLFEMPNTQEIE